MIVTGMIWFAAFLFSTTLHEAAHALAAMRLGDKTAYYGGQVTTDPIPHIRREPIGMVLMPLISLLMFKGNFVIGWASAPYDIQWARSYPKRAAYMALAGPATNLILALLSVAAIHIGIYFELLTPPQQISFPTVVWTAETGSYELFALVVNIFFSLNLLLFILNLVPLPPLDGSAIIYLFVDKETAGRIMDVMHNPIFSLMGLLVVWYLLDDIFAPIWLKVINLLYPGLSYG